MSCTSNQVPADSTDTFPFTSTTDAIATDTLFDDGDFSALAAALTAAQAPSSQYDTPWMVGNEITANSSHSTTFSSPLTPGTPITRPKLGTRFSREVIRVLKTWLAAHQHNPYPRDDDIMLLQQRTGLNQAQLANWFANARRRGKAQNARPATPRVRNHSSNPIEIIPRPGTPALQQDSRLKDPLQRWVDSPPEHEPADVGDIARAMAFGPQKVSYVNNIQGFSYAFDDEWQSSHMSSASSACTSQSSDNSAHHSSGSQSSLKVRKKARKKRTARRRPLLTHLVANPSSPYECTFCTETFKTRYDWQRHEKALHLPLEKWVCALHGPRAVKANAAELCCVFCGEVNPQDAHIESHHYTLCQERDPDERAFHRKDHLVQHLRLVHQAKFEPWSMKDWMVPMPDINSRCGFCGFEMTKWEERTDHLAEHFKMGASMRDWKGDWGFDDKIRRLVESAVPPYFVYFESHTLVPMRASDPPWGSPPNGYELIKIEIEFFIQNFIDHHNKLPADDEIQIEACRIIFAADSAPEADLSPVPVMSRESWLRDLVMSSDELTKRARFGPIRTSSESRHSPLRINGKEHVFEDCPCEAQLRAYVVEQQISGLSITNAQLQTKMCELVRHMECISVTPSGIFANWLLKCIGSGTWWFQEFKQRAGMVDTINRSSVMQDTCAQQEQGQWQQTANDSFFVTDPLTTLTNQESFHSAVAEPLPSMGMPGANLPSITLDEQDIIPLTQITMFDTHGRSQGFLSPEDTNFFRIFESDMRRWVASTMSPKNPNCHVPSDQEIQHQARWIVYDGDDPWNQTLADDEEWLWRFKVEMGITREKEAMPTGSTQLT
ncbi:hypothetical protein ACEQ8H_002051 [Pleosporales sp. CAS-2024a]